MNDAPSIGSEKIVVYSRPNCTDCKNVKDILDEIGLKRGKDYIYHDVRQEPDAQAEVTRLCAASNVSPRVPVIVFSPDLVFIEPQEEKLVDFQMAAMARVSLTGERVR